MMVSTVTPVGIHRGPEDCQRFSGSAAMAGIITFVDRMVDTE